MDKKEHQYLTADKSQMVSMSKLINYCYILGMATLLLALLLWFCISLSQLAFAKIESVDRSEGILLVYGALSENACRLDMDSVYQEVDLGVAETKNMQKVGDRGNPVVVRLRLLDCFRESIGNEIISGRNLPYLPLAKVGFWALQDEDIPELVALQGVEGVGLRITDDSGRKVIIGELGNYLRINSNQDALTYSFALERTNAELSPGHYTALVGFSLRYE